MCCSAGNVEATRRRRNPNSFARAATVKARQSLGASGGWGKATTPPPALYLGRCSAFNGTNLIVWSASGFFFLYWEPYSRLYGAVRGDVAGRHRYNFAKQNKTGPRSGFAKFGYLRQQYFWLCPENFWEEASKPATLSLNAPPGFVVAWLWRESKGLDGVLSWDGGTWFGLRCNLFADFSLRGLFL